jgi:DNA repair protein RecN (Recombination protein N)
MNASSSGLKRISLRDFVIVQALDLDISNGFTVLTGETGAGKSILIDAVQLVLGSRADAGVVREGCARAEISAEFEAGTGIQPWLEEAGFALEDTLLLRRSIDVQGKSRAWINGSPATATQLREVGDMLVDIHGQHAWAALTRPDAVRGLLDAYAGIDTKLLHAAWQAWKLCSQLLEQARTQTEQNSRELERLSWQISELGKLAPQAGEWEELNAQHTRLAHAQSLLETAQTSVDLLETDDKGVLPALSKALHALQSKEHLEPRFAEYGGMLNQALAQIEDVARSLHAYVRAADLDPSSYEKLDARVSTWISMARKYKRGPETLAALLSSWQAQLQVLERGSDMAALERELLESRSAFDRLASHVSSTRAKQAKKLALAITQAMQGLGMQGGLFDVKLHATNEPSPHGMETVEFLVAGHPGATPKAVGKVASGGELSRIALAIAVTTSQLGTAQTLIFDEVDSGVGGAVAETVGRLMKQLGKDRQVLAVTHLPQVAACADGHLVVTKLRGAKSTLSDVQPVSGELRVAEIARMLSGERLSSTTLAHAKELLNQ